MRHYARRVPEQARELSATIEAIAWLYALSLLLLALVVT